MYMYFALLINSAHYLPGAVLGTGDALVNKIGIVPSL